VPVDHKSSSAISAMSMAKDVKCELGGSNFKT